MEKYIIEGGRPLYGEVEIQSAKNAVLPLLAAAVLTEQKVVIHKCPRITDVLNMVQILCELGFKTRFEGEELEIDGADAANHEIPAALAKEMRSSGRVRYRAAADRSAFERTQKVGGFDR